MCPPWPVARDGKCHKLYPEGNGNSNFSVLHITVKKHVQHEPVFRLQSLREGWEAQPHVCPPGPTAVGSLCPGSLGPPPPPGRAQVLWPVMGVSAQSPLHGPRL